MVILLMQFLAIKQWKIVTVNYISEFFPYTLRKRDILRLKTKLLKIRLSGEIQGIKRLLSTIP